MTNQRNLTIVITLVIAVIALAGLWAYIYFGDSLFGSPVGTHREVYTALLDSNDAFKAAEALLAQGRYTEALPLYRQALAVTNDPTEQFKIKLMIAIATAFKGDYLQSIPLFKELAAMDPESTPARGRATAVQEMANLLATYKDPRIEEEIFKDEPYASLRAGNTAISFRHLYEYAASIYPLATSELRTALWYAIQLPNADTANLSAATKAEYTEKVKQLVAIADADIAYMRNDPYLLPDLRTALQWRALVLGSMQRAGDTSLGDANEQFNEVIAFTQELGPGQDGLARYDYAIFLAQMYGASKKTEIEELLLPLRTPVYANVPIRNILETSRFSSFYIQFPRLLAEIDPEFKEFLLTLGWTETDFAS